MSDDEHHLLLHPDRPLRLDAARHAELRVDSGVVWITASGAAGDVFLSSGQSYRVPRKGTVLVEAVRGTADGRLITPRWRLMRSALAWLRNPRPKAATQAKNGVASAPTFRAGNPIQARPL